MRHTLRPLAASLALLGAAGSAHALEPNTLPSYLNGAEGFMAGAVPPPGFYGLEYASSYRATRLNDAQGNAVPIPGFQVRLDALVTRLAWVTGRQVLGGDLVLHTLLPLAQLSSRTLLGEPSTRGLADAVVGAGLGFHHSPQLHSVLALDVHLPTGSFDASRPVNLGARRWAIEPVVAVTRVDPAGFNGDVRVGLTVHGRNRSTQYRSGADVHADYAAGWALQPQWVLGVGGHVHQQLEDDHRHGAAVADSRARSAAIGPMLKFDSGRGWLLTLKWQKEFATRNLPQGSGLYLKAAMPL